MTDFQNYLGGAAPAYDNAMSRRQQAMPQMSMEEWQAYLASLTPQQLEELQTQGINWGNGAGGSGINWGQQDGGGGSPIDKVLGMLGQRGAGAGSDTSTGVGNDVRARGSRRVGDQSVSWDSGADGERMSRNGRSRLWGGWR